MANRLSPLLVNFGPGVNSLGQKLKNFGYAYLVEHLRDQAEMLQGGERCLLQASTNFGEL